MSGQGAGRLVVDVPVAGGVTQLPLEFCDLAAVVGINTAGQSVFGRVCAVVDDFVVLVLLIDVDRENRREELVVEALVVQRFDLDDSRVDEQSLAVIVAAAEQVRVFIVFCGIDVFCCQIEGVAVDDGAHQDAEILDVADADGRHSSCAGCQSA